MEPAEKAAAMDILAEQVRVLSETVRQVEAKSLELQELMEPEPDVPLPERFSGARTQYPSFKLDCELLFVLKPRTYARDFVKVRAAITLMSGRIKSWAHQLLLTEDPSLLTWDSFVKAMDHWVSQPQPRSGTRPAATCHRPLRLPEEAFRPAVPRPGSGRDVHYPHLEDSQGESPTLPSTDDIADEEEPMILGYTQTFHPQGEQARRRHLGLCFYCGLGGHFISFCPVRPPRMVHRGPVVNYPVTSPRPEMRYLGCAYCCPCPRPREVPTTEVCRPAAKACRSVPLTHPTEAQYRAPEPSALTPSFRPALQNGTHGKTAPRQDPVAPTVAQGAVEVPPRKSKIPEAIPLVPALSGIGIVEPVSEELAPGLMYASNGTLICKEDEKVFEAALKAGAGESKKKSRNKHK